jgi:hypothetical protein
MTEQPLGDEDQEETNQEKEFQEDEEQFDDNDYIPDFIQEMLDTPPVLPGESADAFVALFESYELDYKQRPKTDQEYFLVLQATTATWELMRYDRMKVAIEANQRRAAVESLHRRTSAIEPLSKEGSKRIDNSTRDGAATYFTDAAYRTEFAAKLKRAGFASNGVEGEAFLRALPSLTAIERLITSTEKRLANTLRKLDAAYATRDPEQRMPRSTAATRTDGLNAKRAEETRKARLNGNDKADSSE